VPSEIIYHSYTQYGIILTKEMDEVNALKPPKLFQRNPPAVSYEIPINQYDIHRSTLSLMLRDL